MHKYIKKLQSKDESTRKQVVILSVIICMSAIVFIWVSDIRGRISNPKNSAKIEQDLKPFVLLKDSMASTYKNVSASVGSISSLKDKLTEEKQIDLIVVEQQ